MFFKDSQKFQRYAVAVCTADIEKWTSSREIVAFFRPHSELSYFISSNQICERKWITWRLTFVLSYRPSMARTSFVASAFIEFIVPQ